MRLAEHHAAMGLHWEKAMNEMLRKQGNMPTVDSGPADSPAAVPVATPARDASVWTDQEFCEAFESQRIPKEWFRHREHIRVAWIYTTRYPEEAAVSRMAHGIRAFAKHYGVEGKYHHTITLAWMLLVRQAVDASPMAADFASFAAANPRLLNVSLLADYYSAELLQSDVARAEWVEPDRCPLPRPATRPCSCGAQEG